MALGQVSIAAATAVIGYDLAGNTVWQQSDRPRRIISIGLKGSAAALDTKVRLTVGPTEVATIFNSGTGAPDRDDLFRVGADVPANQEVHAFVEDAPSTNPLQLVLDFES